MSRNKPNRTKPSITRRQRRIPKSGDIILIVCEGKKTEPDYFEDLKIRFNNKSTQVKIIRGKSKSTPEKVVQYAIDLKMQREQSDRFNYDEIWCVFDEDNRRKQVDKAKIVASKYLIYTAHSNPCFEIWYKLHFKYSTRQYNNYTELETSLKKHIPNYDKETFNDFELLYKKIETALSNAAKLRKRNTDNPYTDVDRLIQSLKVRQKVFF